MSEKKKRVFFFFLFSSCISKCFYVIFPVVCPVIFLFKEKEFSRIFVFLCGCAFAVIAEIYSQLYRIFPNTPN